MNSDDKNLSDLRKDIDMADREIVRWLMKRAEYARSIGRLKQSGFTPLYRPDREKEVYKNVTTYARELFGETLPLPESVLRNIYREIMSGSLFIEGGPGIAFLGPVASFSHLAVRGRFGSAIREFPVDSIPEVFRIVEARDDVTYGVVPVDNSSGGSVGATLDMLLISDLKVYAEQYIRVNQHLISNEDIPFKEIKKIYTIKIVYEQCRNWIHSNLNMAEVEIIETSSTASAARIVSEKKDGVAIASDLAAQTYGLKIISSNIQDSLNNITRFFVLAKNQCPPTGDDKTSIICSIKDKPGSLFEMLMPFHNGEINLTRIESVATRKTYGDYNFFIDFLGHTGDEKIKNILELLETKTSMLKILGSYPRADIP